MRLERRIWLSLLAVAAVGALAVAAMARVGALLNLAGPFFIAARVGVIVVLVLSLLWLMRLLAGWIMRPLAGASTVIEALRDGDFSLRLREAHLGPLDELAHSINLLAESMRVDALNRVQIDIVAGGVDTPLADAYALQLTYPIHGREALTTILEPSLTVRPPTLLLPTLPQRNLRQANMIYGPAQSALAHAIVDGLATGLIPRSAPDEELMITLATVHPQALDRHGLYQSVYAAARHALAGAYGEDD